MKGNFRKVYCLKIGMGQVVANRKLNDVCQTSVFL